MSKTTSQLSENNEKGKNPLSEFSELFEAAGRNELSDETKSFMKLIRLHEQEAIKSKMTKKKNIWN